MNSVGPVHVVGLEGRPKLPTTPRAGSSLPSRPGCRDNLQIRMPTSDRHCYSFARGTVSKGELGSPYPRATVTVKKSWDNSPFDGCSAGAVGMQRLWWSWEGGGGRGAYDSADNKWALYAVARDSHSCSSPRSLLRYFGWERRGYKTSSK